jgi:putative Holliday junction resolvase
MTDPEENTDELPIPPEGRIVGIDFGTVRIGLAITDPSQSIASPLTVYARRSTKLDQDFFVKLVQTEQAVGFVIGLPIHLSGDSSPKSKAAQAFGEWLQQITHLPVTWIDERFTTAFARETLSNSQLSGKKRKSRLDKIAAQILLSAYLETRQNSASQNTCDPI